MTVSNLARLMFGAVFLGAVSAVFAISFAAILYSGEMAQFLDRGIGLTLLGCIVLGAMGAFVLSYRGSILQAQDVPAILLAGAGATLAATPGLEGDALFATMACLVVVTTLLTGCVAWLSGYFRLAHMARFIPYPVLAGFLAATGLLLLLGGMGVAVGTSLSPATLPTYLTAQAITTQWGPTLLAAIGIVVATRLFPGPISLPIALVLSAVAFYGIIWLTGVSGTQAQARGLLLGPFEQDGFLSGVSPALILQADWAAIGWQSPVILTIILISLIGSTLNASGLELELGEDLDISHELRGVGLANGVAALVGGMPGYHLLGETILARRLGFAGSLAGLSGAAGCAIILVFGAGLLSVLPVGVFAAVIAFLGLDLLVTWLWESRRRLGLLDYAIVVLIPIIAVTFSFLTAIAAGLFLSSAIFVVAYAKLDVIRLQSSAAVRRSFVERPDSDLEALTHVGQAAQIIELTGYLFFGSANLLRERVQTTLSSAGEQVRWMLLDFRQVSGADISTWHVLRRLAEDCAARNVTLILTSLPTAGREDFNSFASTTGCETSDSLDHALEQIEDTLLQEQDDEGQRDGIDLSETLAALFAQAGLPSGLQEQQVNPGETLIAARSRSDEIFILREGSLSVLVGDGAQKQSVVAKIRPGAILGEMAYYTRQSRSADIIADVPSVVLRIDMAGLEALQSSHPQLVARFHKQIARYIARRLSRTTTLLHHVGY